MTSAEQLAEQVSDVADELDDELSASPEAGMGKAHDTAEQRIEQNDSDVTGNLKDSLQVKQRIPESSAFASARLLVDEEYSPFVEYGTGDRQAGFFAEISFAKFKEPDPRPPVGRIRQWIIRKGIKANAGSEMRRVNIIEEQEQLAWAIANSIGEYGNNPSPFARPAARDGFDAAFDVAYFGAKNAVNDFN